MRTVFFIFPIKCVFNIRDTTKIHYYYVFPLTVSYKSLMIGMVNESVPWAEIAVIAWTELQLVNERKPTGKAWYKLL